MNHANSRISLEIEHSSSMLHLSVEAMLICGALCSLLLGPVPIKCGGREPNVFVGDVVICMAAIYAFIGYRPHHMSDRLIRAVVAWMGLYCVVMLATLPRAADILRSIADAKLYIMPLIVFITSARCFRSKVDLQRILLTCSVVGIGLSVGALYNWSRFQSGAMELQSGLAAKDMVQMAGLRSNAVGGTAAILLPGAMYALWHASYRWRLIGLVSLLGLCATIIFSMSRGSMIAALIGVGASLILRVLGRSRGTNGKAMWTLVAIAMAVCLGWQLFPAQLKLTLLTQIEIANMQVSTQGETNARFTRWEILIQRGMKNPQGVGVGNYENLSAVQDARLGGSAHNLYLETLEEEGWLGLATLLLGLAYAWRAGRRMLSARKAMIDEWTAVNMAWLVFLVNVAVEPNYFSVQFTYIFWIIVGTAAAAGAMGSGLEHGEAGWSASPLARAR